MRSPVQSSIRRWLVSLGAVSVALTAAIIPTHAEVRIGVVVSATGSTASLGIPEKNTIALLPKKIAGQDIKYIILDDASDSSVAVKNMRKLVSEFKVDAVIGSTTAPNTNGMAEVAYETKTPIISMAASASMIEPMDDKKSWVFKTPQNDRIMAKALVKHMVGQKIKTVAFIGFADNYGESWFKEFSQAAKAAGLQIVTDERYQRNDTAVTGQVLRIISKKPDAVMIAAAGTPAALPQTTLRDRGFKGPIYQTHGVANNDFLKVGGKQVEGTVLPAGPVLVAQQLPDSNPVKASALEYIKKYEALYGAGSISTFGAHAWDAGKILEAALTKTLQGKAVPGTQEFRVALRSAIESTTNVAGAHGIFTMSKTDHSGLDDRSYVMVKIENGKWKFLAE